MDGFSGGWCKPPWSGAPPYRDELKRLVISGNPAPPTPALTGWLLSHPPYSSTAPGLRGGWSMTLLLTMRKPPMIGLRHYGPYQILQGWGFAFPAEVGGLVASLKSRLLPRRFFFPTDTQLTGTALSILYSQFINLTASCPTWFDLLSRLLHSLSPLSCPASLALPRQRQIYSDEMAAQNIISKSERTGTTCLEMCG
jgi:hypothetical protein